MTMQQIVTFCLQVRAFHDILHSEHGIACTIRQEKGQEISGACGQLAVDCSKGSSTDNGTKSTAKLAAKRGKGSKSGVADIEELAQRLLTTQP